MVVNRHYFLGLVIQKYCFICIRRINFRFVTVFFVNIKVNAIMNLAHLLLIIYF